jgi:hypothetical protein
VHGYFRWSYNQAGALAEKYDLDIWYNPTFENYFRLINTLEYLDQNVSEFKVEKSPNPKSSFFRFEMDKFTLDFLPTLKGLSKFSLSFENREVINFNGTDILVISFDDLIKDKETDARPKDLQDIKQLMANKNQSK